MVATQRRVAAEQGRRQEELEEEVATLEAELKAAAADPAVQAHQNDAENKPEDGSAGDKRRSMSTVQRL